VESKQSVVQIVKHGIFLLWFDRFVAREDQAELAEWPYITTCEECQSSETLR
jgi:hypothetical protein